MKFPSARPHSHQTWLVKWPFLKRSFVHNTLTQTFAGIPSVGTVRHTLVQEEIGSPRLTAVTSGNLYNGILWARSWLHQSLCLKIVSCWWKSLVHSAPPPVICCQPFHHPKVLSYPYTAIMYIYYINIGSAQRRETYNMHIWHTMTERIPTTYSQHSAVNANASQCFLCWLPHKIQTKKNIKLAFSAQSLRFQRIYDLLEGIEVDFCFMLPGEYSHSHTFCNKKFRDFR